MRSLVKQYTIVLVTHNMQQAIRVSEMTGFMLADEWRVGHLVEFITTQQLFQQPSDSRTEDYVRGRIG